MKNLFACFILALLVISSVTNCARKGSPTGGPKDTISPIMVIAKPEYEAINFTAKKIKLEFDEYIKFKDLNKQLIVSPPLKHASEITPVGTASKKITIEILDTLKENTTYSFNFGNSIVDNNEGNPLGSFKYVFSTGSYVDSLEIYGNVKNSFDREADTNIAVLLYEVDQNYTDSIIYKEKPTYITNTLDTTAFDITNIKEGTYQLIALKDFNNNFIYNPKDDKIAFLTKPIELPTDSVFTLSLFDEIKNFRLIRPLEKRVGKIIFGYEGDKSGLNIELISKTPKNFESFLSKEKDKDTLNFWFTPFETDSLQFKIKKDTLEKVYTVKLRTSKQDSLLIDVPVSNVLNPRDTFSLNTNFPIRKIDPKYIFITDHDTLAVPFMPIVNKEKSKLSLEFKEKRNGRYQIDILPNALVDFYGRTNDTLQYTLKTEDIESYGIIELSIVNPKNRKILIDVITKNYELIEQRKTSEGGLFEFKDLQPDSYLIRIIFDENNNNKWDTGNFLKKIQPEKVYYFESELKLKANWTINETIDIETIR